MSHLTSPIVNQIRDMFEWLARCEFILKRKTRKNKNMFASMSGDKKNRVFFLSQKAFF